MNCKQPLALTVGQAPPYPMLWQKPVAGVPTRTRENRQRVCACGTPYGLPKRAVTDFVLTAPTHYLTPVLPTGKGIDRLVCGQRLVLGAVCNSFCIPSLTRLVCCPHPDPPPRGRG